MISSAAWTSSSKVALLPIQLAAPWAIASAIRSRLAVPGIIRTVHPWARSGAIRSIPSSGSPDGEPLDGIDLIAPLRAQGWTVLMITGTASLDRIADAIAQGAASWIGKSATFDELVHAALEIMRARDPQL